MSILADSDQSTSTRNAESALKTCIKHDYYTVMRIIAHVFCLEVDVAIEKGIRVVVKEMARVGGDDDDQAFEAEEITSLLLAWVEHSIGNAFSPLCLPFIRDRVMQSLGAKPEKLARYQKQYKIFPEIAIEATRLPDRYCEVVRFMMQEVFHAYNNGIERGLFVLQKQKSSSPTNISESIIDEIIQNIHSHCCQVPVNAEYLQVEMERIITRNMIASSRVDRMAQNETEPRNPQNIVSESIETKEVERTNSMVQDDSNDSMTIKVVEQLFLPKGNIKQTSQLMISQTGDQMIPAEEASLFKARESSHVEAQDKEMQLDENISQPDPNEMIDLTQSDGDRAGREIIDSGQVLLQDSELNHNGDELNNQEEKANDRSNSSQSDQPVRRRRLRRMKQTEKEDDSDDEASQISFSDDGDRSDSSQLSGFVVSTDDEMPDEDVRTLGYSYRE